MSALNVGDSKTARELLARLEPPISDPNPGIHYGIIGAKPGKPCLGGMQGKLLLMRTWPSNWLLISVPAHSIFLSFNKNPGSV